MAVTGQFGRGTGQLTGIAVATADGPAAWFDPALDQDDEAAVAAWLSDGASVFHNTKPVRLAAASHGWRLPGWCTTRRWRPIVRPDQRSCDLADLSLRYLGRSCGPTGSTTRSRADRLATGEQERR